MHFAAAALGNLGQLAGDFPAVLKEHDVRMRAGKADVRDPGADEDFLPDKSQILRRANFHAKIHSPRIAAKRAGVNRRSHGFGQPAGIEHAADFVGVVRAVAQQRHRLSLRPLVVETGVDGRGKIGALPGRPPAFQIFDIGGNRRAGKRAQPNVEAIGKGFAQFAGRTGRCLIAGGLPRIRGIHAGGGIDQHGQQRLPRWRRNIFDADRVEQQDHHQRERQRHQADDRDPAPQRNDGRPADGIPCQQRQRDDRQGDPERGGDQRFKAQSDHENSKARIVNDLTTRTILHDGTDDASS